VAQIRKEAFQRVAGAVEMLHVQAERLAEQARADALEIGFLVARKILETEVRASPEPLFALVKSALRRAGESRRVVIRLSPDDAAALHARKDGLTGGGLSSALIEIVPTADLEPGDCLVETDFGKIDGRLATRLEEVRRSVKSALEGDAA
jgi:flagellar assembly protein FliH